MKYIREKARERPVRPPAQDLPDLVALSGNPLPAPVRALYAAFPAIEDRHRCAVFFDDMARCFGGHFADAGRAGLFRTLDGPEARDAMDFFKRKFPRHAVVAYETYATFTRQRLDHYERYLQALSAVDQLVQKKKLPADAAIRFMDTTATLIDGIRRAKLP